MHKIVTCQIDMLKLTEYKNFDVLSAAQMFCCYSVGIKNIKTSSNVKSI